MRIAEIIGTVTLSKAHPALAGHRLAIGVPFSLKALQEDNGPDGEDLVIVDMLGAGYGSRIGLTEGVEAAAPFFPEKKPVDAYCGCLLDRIAISE